MLGDISSMLTDPLPAPRARLAMAQPSLASVAYAAALLSLGPALLSSIGSAARATPGELRPAVAKPHFTCEAAGALRAGWQAAPSQAAMGQAPLLQSVALGPIRSDRPCCDGQIGCAQFLPSNTPLRSAHRWHG